MGVIDTPIGGCTDGSAHVDTVMFPSCKTTNTISDGFTDG